MSGPLKAYGENLWLAHGPVVPFLGVPYPTRMAVARLAGGELWVWSPIRLMPEMKAAVEALGTPRYLVSPNKLHHLYLAEWKAAWPAARLAGTRGAARKLPDLSFDIILDTGDPMPWGGEILCQPVYGSWAMTEVEFLHAASRTALVCDLIQRFDPSQLNFGQRTIMRLWSLTAPDGMAPLEWRLSFLNRKRARVCVERILAWNPARLVIAHGLLPEGDGTEEIRKGFRWLLTA